MPDVDVELIKQEVLSLLVSSKNGLTEHELLKDFRSFNSNRDIPYRELGHPTLISLLRTWPDVCRVQFQGNQNGTRIFAVEEENTKHILSMVKQQKSSKSRRRARGGAGGNRGRYGKGRGGQQRNAPSVHVTFNNYRGQFDSNGRGGSFNSRMNHNTNQRFDRPIPTAAARPGPAPSNFNGKRGSNTGTAPRFAKPHVIRTTNTYQTQRSVESSGSDDRRTMDDFTSLRVTVSNGNNQIRAEEFRGFYSNPSRKEVEVYENEEESNEDYDDKEEEVLNNLRALLTEYSHGIRLLSLEELYQKKFHGNLLKELNISNILLLQEFVDDFALISRHGEENGSCDHIITLKDPKQVAESNAELLRKITDSGIVRPTYSYANNLLSYINDHRFQGCVSDVDQQEHGFHIQPVRYQGHIETLMEELDSYYSSPVSNTLIVKQIQTGLCCVTKFHGIYHRVFIKESDLYRCVVVYVDYGTTEEVEKSQQQFKHLLNHFAELPCMAIACRLDDVKFLPDDQHWFPDTYREVYSLCENGPFYIEPAGNYNGLLTVRILDADERSLNDIVVELNLAVKISTLLQYEQPHRPQPVTLSLDLTDSAVHCPLPDSDPPSPDIESNQVERGFFENLSSISHRCKFVTLDEKTSFHLIRYDTNKPYVACFDLARLLHQSESEILSETFLSRIRLDRTADYQRLFDLIQQSYPIDCLHLNQNFLFIFDLSLVVRFIEKVHWNKQTDLVQIFKEQIEAAKDEQFWKTFHIRVKRSSTESSQQSDNERYGELLARRRNILCNLLRTDHISELTVELESIENELRQIIEKKRLTTPSEQQSQVSLTPPPGFPGLNTEDPQRSVKRDKLKELMQRCKTLINTILTLDSYVVIDDTVIDYIAHSLPFLNSGHCSVDEEYLYNQYTDLLKNLTTIVNDLQQRLPTGVDIS